MIRRYGETERRGERERDREEGGGIHMRRQVIDTKRGRERQRGKNVGFGVQDTGSNPHSVSQSGHLSLVITHMPGRWDIHSSLPRRL